MPNVDGFIFYLSAIKVSDEVEESLPAASLVALFEQGCLA